MISIIKKILEYRAAHPTVDGGLTWVETNFGTRFACTVTINETSHFFGGNTVTFLKKKDAKQHAAKKTIDWLIENGYMPADGSVKFPKPAPLVNPPKARGAVTFAGQVPELCTRLGFSIPTYEIVKVSEEASFYSGYAHFNGDPRIDGKVGEFRNVYGKKQAKERCAEEVLLFLKDIERQTIEAKEGESNKRNRVLGSSEAREIGKTMKQTVEEVSVSEAATVAE